MTDPNSQATDIAAATAPTQLSLTRYAVEYVAIFYALSILLSVVLALIDEALAGAGSFAGMGSAAILLGDRFRKKEGRFPTRGELRKVFWLSVALVFVTTALLLAMMPQSMTGLSTGPMLGLLLLMTPVLIMLPLWVNFRFLMPWIFRLQANALAARTARTGGA